MLVIIRPYHPPFAVARLLYCMCVLRTLCARICLPVGRYGRHAPPAAPQPLRTSRTNGLSLGSTCTSRCVGSSGHYGWNIVHPSNDPCLPPLSARSMYVRCLASVTVSFANITLPDDGRVLVAVMYASPPTFAIIAAAAGGDDRHPY